MSQFHESARLTLMKSYLQWQKQHPHKAAVLHRCASAIRQLVPEAEVILYGSAARGDDHADSDIDLLVLVPQTVTPELRREIRGRVYDVALESDQIITTIVRQRAQWHSEPLNCAPLYEAIASEGVQL